jgi:hypothetical protein
VREKLLQFRLLASYDFGVWLVYSRPLGTPCVGNIVHVYLVPHSTNLKQIFLNYSYCSNEKFELSKVDRRNSLYK